MIPLPNITDDLLPKLKETYQRGNEQKLKHEIKNQLEIFIQQFFDDIQLKKIEARKKRDYEIKIKQQ